MDKIFDCPDIRRVLAMSAIGRCVPVAIAALVLLHGGSAMAAEEVTRGLVVSSATIVDTRTGNLLPDQTIVIDAGKIVKIAPAGEITAAGAAQSVDGRGKFVVPGFLEMHAHPLMSVDTQGALALMLANGVTGFRQLAGTPALLEMRRAGKLPLSGLTPELLSMPGLILTPGNARTPAMAIAEVQSQKAQGADFIKMVEAPPPAFYAALEEAGKLGLPFIGHLQVNVNVNDAAEKGMREIAHMGPRDSVLLACSTDEEELRRVIAQPPPPPAGGAAPNPAAPNPAALSERTLAAALANPMLLTRPSDFPRYQRVIDTYSEAKCRKLAERFVASGTWHTPTLIRLRTMQFGDNPQYRGDSNLKYMPLVTRRMWEELAQQFPSKIPPAAVETLKQLFALHQKVVKLFDESGVKMLAGSDFGGQWIMPGFGLHQEFDLLEEAGLSPLAVLQMTTLNGARFLNREASMGTVEAGKDANLVLLDANPVASVQNLHKIHAVIRAGAFYPRAALDEMKQKTENAVAAPASTTSQ